MGLLKRVVLVCLLACSSWAAVSSKLNIEEEDGDPSVFPYKLKVTNGALIDNGDGTASLTASGGGGSGPTGQINNGNTYQTPYYSVSGSSNVLSATSNLRVFPSSVTIRGALPILSTSTLQSGATVYVSSGNIAALTSNMVTTNGIAASSGTIHNTLYSNNLTLGIDTSGGHNTTGVTFTDVGATAGSFVYDNASGGQFFFRDSANTNKTVFNLQTGLLTNTYGIVGGSLTASNLASGQCVQTGTGGLLTVTGSACGSGGGSGGIVSPGTFTWTNTNGISVSTITVSTITANQIPYAGGVGGGLIGSPYLTFYSSNSVGAIGTENLIHRGFSPFYVFDSSNAMGVQFFDAYQQYNNANMWGALIVHPNAYPSIAQGSMNLYMRDGSNIQLDVTGQNGYNAGTIQLRSSDQNNEGTPHVGFQYDSTRTVVVTDITNNVDGISGYGRYVPHEYSAVLEASSTTRGFLPPRLTTTQKNAIASPAAGLMVYDTTLATMTFYNGSGWIVFGGGGGGSGSPGGSTGQLQYNNGGSFAGVSGSFVTASSTTLSTVTIRGSLGINSQSPAETFKIVQLPDGTGGSTSASSFIVYPSTDANGTVFEIYNAKQQRSMYLDSTNGQVDVTWGISAGSGTYATSLTVAGQNVCQANGTNCPAASGGASALGVGVGTVAGYTNLVASPTAGVNFNSSKFSVQLAGSATAYVDLLNAVTMSSFTATQPILYNNATGAFSATPISLSTGAVGTLQAAQMPALTGDITTSGGSLATTLASVVTANQYGSATVVPVITFDAKGRITAVSSATITGGSGDAVLSATQTFSGANTFSSTVNISSVATVTSLALGTTNYAAYGSSGTITPDATKGTNISITLTSSATINVPINAQDFQMFRYRIIQDAAGSRAVTLGSGFAFGTDVSSATFSTAANKIDYLACIYNTASSKCHIVSPAIRGY